MIMFGAEYVEGATTLSILSFAFFIASVLGYAVYVLQTYGRTRIIMKGYFITAGVNFVLNLLLIPRYGINGAAIATGLSFSLMSIIYLFAVWRIGKMQPFRMNNLKPVFASILSVLVVYGLVRCIGTTLPILIVMLFVFLIVYFFLLLIFRSFEEEDLMIMSAIDERLGMRSDWLRKLIGKFL